MELSVRRPSLYDRERARVQFHQCALLSSELRRTRNYTILCGLAPLGFVWRPLLCLPFLAMSDTDHRQEMGEDNGCIVNGPSCCWFHCVYSWTWHVNVSFVSIKIYARKQKLVFWEWCADSCRATVGPYTCLWTLGHYISLDGKYVY